MRPKPLIPSSKPGFALVSALIIMAALLLISGYLADLMFTESKIAASQSAAVKAYYLAESGIAEAIWRIKYDQTWKDNFENNPDWTIDYRRESVLYSNGSYQIQLNNTGLAKAEIIATGFFERNEGTAQRIVKTIVYKGLSETIIGDAGEFADGDINISGSVMNIYNGSMASNKDIDLDFWSTANVDNEVRAAGNVSIDWSSTVNASEILEGIDPVPMPAISFSNPDDPNSYLNQADAIYTEEQFENLLWDNQNLVLEGITYVSGDIDIKGGQNLTVNGLLVSEGNIEVGKNTFFCCWGLRCDQSNVTINQTSSTSPAGLLANGRIDFELCLNDFLAEGLIYAHDRISILSMPGNFEIVGGLIGWEMNLSSIWQGISVTFNNGIINYTLGDPNFSPIVTIEHWEEQY